MNKFISGIMLLVILAVFSTPSMANYAFDGFDVAPRASGTLNGETFYDYAAWDGSTDITLTTNVPAGTVKYAYLYTGTWCGNPQNAGNVGVTFNGNGAGTFCDDGYEFGSIYITGENDVNPNVWCTGFGKSWWYYNVTSLVVPGADNTARNWEIDGNLDGRVYGVVLVVVLEDENKPLIQYWINDRSEALNYNTPNNDDETYFDGVVDTGNVAKSALTSIVITGYEPNCDYAMKFNGNLMYTGQITSNNFWMGTWDETEPGGVVTPANVQTPRNTYWYSRCNDGGSPCDPFVNICLGMLELQLEEPDLPDLTPTNIEFPKVMRPQKPYTIDATISNLGSTCGSFDVSLYVDNDLQDTYTVTGGLPASGSTIVNLDVDPLPKGCYEFKVVADSGSAIGESNENNNEILEDYQVGYVIIVESNDDFLELDVGGDYELPAGCFLNDGGIYYIQDMTGSNSIENCAIECCGGIGITIKNTNAKFVIRDCMIENCADTGVFLHSLTDGTIEDSIIRNNVKYGIELGKVPLDADDPEFINISRNELYQNLYGIEVIGYKNIIKDNIVRNNDDEGIYLYGNENKICNNILEENGNYGMKVYDSADNLIYWNSFTNNNGGGVQGYDNSVSNTWNQVNKEYPYYTIYTGCTGNCWDDQTAPDNNNDGIVETPYALGGGAGEEDSYPLVTLPRIFDIPIYNGKNLIAIPLIQDDPSLDAVFGDDPVNMDRVYRYISGEYKSVYYWDGVWYPVVNDVEPIEIGVGYVYQRVGTDYTLTVQGTRCCCGTISTPIYTGKNLIGYVNFTNTDLSTFNSPVNMDRVYRYIGGEYKSVYYWDGVWYPVVNNVEPIEVGVGYVYQRESVDYNWTYNA